MLVFLLPSFTFGNCSETARLCLNSLDLEVGKSFDLFWSQSQVPITINPNGMILSLYQGDIYPITQPCQIDSSVYPFMGRIPFSYSASGKTSVVIPPSQNLTDAISRRNQFFFQLWNPANVNCQIGPIAGSGAINHFTLRDIEISKNNGSLSLSEALTTSTNQLSPSPTPSNQNSPTTTPVRRLSTAIIILIVACSLVFILLCLAILLVLIRRRRAPRLNHKSSMDLQSLVNLNDQEPQVLLVDPESNPKPSNTVIQKLTPKDAMDISQAFKDALSEPVKDNL